MGLTCSQRQIAEQSFLFRNLPEQALDWALANGRVEEAGRGALLYTPGRFMHSLGLVLSGRVRVTRGDLLVDVLETGGWFGAAALFNGREEYPSTLTALSECQVLFLSQETVETLFERWPDAAVNYIRYLSGRICFLSDRVNSLSAGSVEEKVARFLLRGADERGVVRTPAASIAKSLGVGRASVYRAFERLEERGMISRSGKEISLTGLNH